MTGQAARRDRLTTIKVRRDFLAVRGGYRVRKSSFLIEAKARKASVTAHGLHSASGSRFGFTVTKKLGNAVTRNRIRRRLKEAVRASLPGATRENFDYVIVAFDGAKEQPFVGLVADIEASLRDITTQADSGPPPPQRRKRRKPRS
ncbi:MAG: ribonuclease P protein component [Pseudomonadota bacterium]